MWKLSKINIENIVSFRVASLDIKQGVATLIFGKNEDNASQPCNGSGKSSLIEAISFALTGEQLRKVKSVEEIINDHADEAYVYLRLENDFNDTVFTIERRISRKAPQVIECHKYNSDGNEIEKDKTIQPTVLDYNKFILDEIGLTKDDIYNNFILCDNKYESFFDCTDKNKKEIINRFSNGAIIDESIERVRADLEPLEIELNTANYTISSIEGSIAAIEIELEQVDEKKANAKEALNQRITNIDRQILQRRQEIENVESKLNDAESRLGMLTELQNKVIKLEESDISVIDAYDTIHQMCETNSLGAISNYKEVSISFNEKIAMLQIDIDARKKEVEFSQSKISDFKAKYDNVAKEYQQQKADEAAQKAADISLKNSINAEIEKIDAQLDLIEDAINENQNRQARLNTLIATNKALLEGVITCPKCQHRFLLNSVTTIDDVKNAISKAQSDIEVQKSESLKLSEKYCALDKEAETKTDSIEEINNRIKARETSLKDCLDHVREMGDALDSYQDRLRRLQQKLSTSESELEKLTGKIEVLRNRLFGEITGILEMRVLNGNEFIKQQKANISSLKGQIESYQQMRYDLINAPETDFSSSLNASLKKYQSDLEDAQIKASEIAKKCNILTEQEVNFTMFKSYIARKKIDALSIIVNDFLEKIGSDIRLKLEGFTVTKTGKLRDKISVQVMRDGIDCGSYHKFSGGEKARLNLACILSLHTLTNSNCEDGKGLDFIIIDELLDKSDEVGMATYCDALNRLGQTALLITQGGVSESYPHKILVTKRQGISTITED